MHAIVNTALALAALPSALAASWQVAVGANGQLAYSPETLPTVAPGDTVVFTLFVFVSI